MEAVEEVYDDNYIRDMLALIVCEPFGFPDTDLLGMMGHRYRNEVRRLSLRGRLSSVVSLRDLVFHVFSESRV